MFRFAAPWVLAFVPVVVAIGFVVVRRRRRADARVALPAAERYVALGRSVWVAIDRSLPWLRVATLVLLLVALARPQTGTTKIRVSTRGVDIMVALDVSESMRAEDFQPKNRLEVAKETLAGFVDGRPTDRLGLVAFGSRATPKCPLTTDHEMLRSLLARVEFATGEEGGTAIGLGLAAAVNRLRESDAASRIVVLLTDGRNNRGQVSPTAAAEAAKALGVRVYTIGVGTEGEVPILQTTATGAKRYVHIQLDLDEPLLREIAESTDGRYFRVFDAEGLEETFSTIDELEKTDIEQHERVLYAELFPRFTVPALATLALVLALAATRVRRLP